MSGTDDLFSIAQIAPEPDRLEVVVGKVVATINQPSPAQRRFNALMADLDAAKSHGMELRRSLDDLAPLHRAALRKVRSASMQLIRRMVVLLDKRIQIPGKLNGLTAKQKQQAMRMLLTLCDQLTEAPDAAVDADVDAIQARYVQHDEGEDEREWARQLEATHAMLASVVGKGFAKGRTFESPEEMVHAAMEFEDERKRKLDEKRQAKRIAGKNRKGPSEKQQATEQKHNDAQSALRTVYRQLASALHPDRAPDRESHAQRTALMSEVNAAYERKDLSVLLRIQLQTEWVDASKVAALSDARLNAMSALLSEQLRATREDNQTLRAQMDGEFGYPSYVRFTLESFKATLQDELDNLQDDVQDMQEDLLRVQDDRELKAWLKEQVRANKAQQQEDDQMAEMMMSMGRRR